MKRVDRTLQILLIITICLSSLLLGMSQGDYEPLFIAFTSAVAAWLFVDVFKWFNLPQWLANLIAIIVTAFTVATFFFTGDPVQQLLGVGKLLVYLQSILLFQIKSARVYWQIMVLSLLQIVVGAVFNLGFEGGVLFIVYMLFAGLSMLYLHLYQQQQMVAGQGSVNGPGRKRTTGVSIQSIPQTSERRQSLRLMTRHYCLMGLGVFVFGIVLFYFLPRENSSWSGPMEVPMRQTGYLERVSLNHPDLIPMSRALEMTVKYRNPGGEDSINPKQLPYLRGLALPKLDIDDNETNWSAASSQVVPKDYKLLPDIRRFRTDWLFQEIVLEPTDDPLLYSPMPPYGVGEEADPVIESCWPLGGITRERSSNKITVSHYRYNLAIPVLADGSFFSAWPYQPRFSGNQPLTEADDPGIWKTFTYMDKSRYPSIVRTAGEIANRIGPENHYRVAHEMENHLLSGGNFTYAVDFRNISRDRSIDAVEDFFANHQTGHCVYYASALTLMLRSQGIPARVVVGFRGGVVNDLGTHLDVEARHGHAWVEAYIRPEDCTQGMKSTGQAGRLGAWMRLDATPPVDFDTLLASNALNYAKSFWRDYVLGLQSDRGATVVTVDGIKLSGFLRLLDLDWWQTSVTTTAAEAKTPGTWQNWVLRASPLIAIAGMAIGIFVYYRRRDRNATKGSFGTRKQGSGRKSIRQRIARLASGVSPRLARWLESRDDRPPVVPFYARMTKLLNQSGWQRQTGQTHREFALQVGQNGQPDASDELGALTIRITDFYYLVRFGARELSENQQADVRQWLEKLEHLLATTGSRNELVMDKSDK